MTSTLIKSGSMNSLASLDLSNPLDSPLTASTTAAFPPLTDISTLIPPKAWSQEDSSPKDTVFGVRGMKRTSSRIFNILVEEEAQKAVSCAHIETNLIADSHRKEDPDQVQCENSDDYDQSYWDTPSSCSTAIEEKVLSTGQVEKLLVEDALRRAEPKPTVEDNHPNNAYWDWPSEPVLESEKKSNMIASILRDEAIRQRLSIESITALETSNQSRSNESSQIESTSVGQVSVDYWSWNSEEEAKVNEDEIVAPHVHDPTHPNHAYWDFPTESKDPESLKQKLISSILKEERIRKLLQAETVEDREVNFHLTREAQEPETKYEYAAEHVLESMPSNYWDFVDRDEMNVLSSLSEEKQEVINRILKEERQRYILSTDNIEINLQRESGNDDRMVEEVNVSSSDDYWQW